VPTARRATPAKESSARLDNKFRSGMIGETCLSLVDRFWLVYESLRRNSDSRLCRLSRAIGLCFGEENAVESRAELPVNHEPENRYHETRHNPARIHQRMEKQNVDN
jgi:hypothetical protein